MKCQRSVCNTINLGPVRKRKTVTDITTSIDDDEDDDDDEDECG